MDERVLGDMPSEGSEGSRRFGIYSGYSPEPKMHSISKIRLMFVLTIAFVVAFAVIFPLVRYATRSKSNSQSLPYPEVANISFSDEDISKTNSYNCSTKVLAFGLDCREAPPVLNISENNVQDTFFSYDVKTVEELNDGIRYEEDSTEVQMEFAETRNTKFDRTGRSKWPVVSTPYPYYSLPKPNPAADDRNGVDIPEQTNIFAIPSDMSTDNFSNYQKPRVNFTPPPYAFTPFPNFTDSYAQLSPYKIPKNYTNIEDILNFMNKQDLHKNPTEKSERILNTRTPMMKVSGKYIMPLDRRRPGEIIVSSSENSEEARPFFNGHAYVSDPFLKFRPANPSEINRLIPVKSGVDLGPRFRKPVSFVPSASVPVDLYAPLPPPNDYSSAGTHTVAIFHPPPTIGNQRPTTPPPRDKPLSVTLDIYPVTAESGPPEVVSSSTPGRVRGRLDPHWRPKTTERPRWRPQQPRRPPVLQGPKIADNHMIVHLNLFPNKRKQYTFPRRGRQESTTPTDQKVTFLPGGQFSSRSDKGTAGEETSTDVENGGTTDSTSSTSEGFNNPPENSALSSFEIEEVYTTTPSTINTEYNNSQDTNIGNHNKEDIEEHTPPYVQRGNEEYQDEDVNQQNSSDMIKIVGGDFSHEGEEEKEIYHGEDGNEEYDDKLTLTVTEPVTYTM